MTDDGQTARGLAALARALVHDTAFRDRFAIAPQLELERFDVLEDELPELAALVEAGSRGCSPEERRACQALVFLALAARHR